MNDSNNLRIAKNSLFLYFRLLLTVAISLYTSRVFLQTLGIVDFGIYSLVGGLIGMFSFLSLALSSSTSRFLTFELGSFNSEKLAKTFKSAITIHIGLAIVIFILAETIGLWLLEYKLVIPEDRIFAARVVYQISILISIVMVLRIPYNAALIAHEKMSIYAYIGIAEAFLKLLILYPLVVFGDFDKLILYSVLMFLVTIIILSTYIYYCSRSFVECRFKLSGDKQIMKTMLSYCSWEIFGNFSVVARGHGINIILNLFFGVIINAATAIATQVQNAVSGFSSSFLVAVQPQIIKLYASGNIKELQKLIFATSKFSFLLLSIISLPLLIENQFLLNIWLNNVPEYAIIFCQLCIINNMISIIFRPIILSVHATGKVKRVNLINGVIYLLVVPISYFMLKTGFSPVVPFIINILLLILGSFSNLIILREYIPEFSIFKFCKEVLSVCFLIVLISSIIPISIYCNMEPGFIRFILVSLTSVITISISTYSIAMNNETRNKLKIFIFSKLRSK